MCVSLSAPLSAFSLLSANEYVEFSKIFPLLSARDDTFDDRLLCRSLLFLMLLSFVIVFLMIYGNQMSFCVRVEAAKITSDV